MVDINALMSPGGGSENGERLYSGYTGVASTALSFGIDKLLAGTKMKKRMVRGFNTSRNTGAPRTYRQRRSALVATASSMTSPDLGTLKSELRRNRYGGSIDKHTLNQSKYVHTAGSTLAAEEFGPEAYHYRPKIYNTTIFDSSLPPGDQHKVSSRIYRTKVAAEHASLSRRKTGIMDRLGRLDTARKLVSGLAWAITIEWAASSAFNMLSPKISASADRSNQEVFTQSRADSAAAYTQRQRAMMAIVDSQSSISNVVGSEAMHFHK